ncbi:unnamed protein product [Calicophoron daubneyi]|uniref:Uncharacterized protein n=1 Tax=Calicophoron daubneyi TaxID=300641 RepID=A0AAV2TV06_CALDB
MPHRYPLLGSNDPQEVKAMRTFGIQAEQDIWDIGSPDNLRVVKHPAPSRFALGLRSAKYPFVPDHSAPLCIPRLAWMSELQNLDYNILLPDFINGLTDNHEEICRVAMAAITDLLKHGPVEKLIDALPTTTIALKEAMAMNNVSVNRRIIEVLKRMCIIQPGIGPDLAFYAREILDPLNFYFEKTKNMRDHIVYKEAIHADLYDRIDEVIKLFLQIAGPEIDTAERNIKRAIPTYQLFREAL